MHAVAQGGAPASADQDQRARVGPGGPQGPHSPPGGLRHIPAGHTGGPEETARAGETDRGPLQGGAHHLTLRRPSYFTTHWSHATTGFPLQLTWPFNFWGKAVYGLYINIPY